MHTKTVIIERVIDQQTGYRSRAGGKYSVVSFVASGERHSSITLDGWPNVQPGSAVAALFRAPNDWKQLIGWVDLSSGEIVTTFPPPSVPSAIVACVLSAGWMAFLLGSPWLWGASSNVRLALWLGTALLALFIASKLSQMQSRRRERQMLNEFRKSLGQRGDAHEKSA